MPQIFYEIIGFGASVMIAFAHIPQIVHIFKGKDSDGISVLAWSLWTVADGMLLIYSLYIQDKVFIFLNSLNCFFALIILLATLWYRLKNRV